MASKYPSSPSTNTRPPAAKSGAGGLSRWLFKPLVKLLLLAALVTIGLVLTMRWAHPFSSAFMLHARLEAVLAGDDHYHNHYEWRDFQHISPYAALAVIASEDQQFPYHFGFDVKSIRAAAAHNEHSRHIRGASTISQQVAKNLFLWNGRSYFRKALEAWFTLLIETLWPKQRILEVYLNIAEFGPGVYGVEAAARQFYRHSAVRLTNYEAATLAAVLPGPRRLHADKPSAYVAARRDWIEGQMRSLGGRTYLEQIEQHSP